MYIMKTIGYHLLEKGIWCRRRFCGSMRTRTRAKIAVDGLPHCITHATVTGTKNGTTLTAANVSYTYGNHMALVKDEISGQDAALPFQR